jgi:hypothetical protein
MQRIPKQQWGFFQSGPLKARASSSALEFAPNGKARYCTVHDLGGLSGRSQEHGGLPCSGAQSGMGGGFLLVFGLKKKGFQSHLKEPLFSSA